MRDPIRRPTVSERMTVLGLLLAASFATRWEWLDFGSMSPDESQYSAHASFLVRSGQSAFESPVLHVYTHWVYGVFARIFGEYEFLELRVFFLFVCFVCAWMIYETCRLALSGWLSGMAGLFFLHIVVYFEGLSANREWLCLPFLLAANLMYLRQPNGGFGTLFCAGFVGALAVWFKEQAVPLCLPIAFDLCAQLWNRSKRRATVRRLSAYALGLVAGLVAPTAPMVLHGTLHEQIDWLLRTEFRYVATGYQGQTLLASVRDYTDALYQHIPFRRLFLAAYVGALFALVSAVGRWLRGADRAENRVLRLTALQLLCAVLAVQLGRRFFLHYYLFLAPSVCILLALVWHWLITQAHTARWGPAVCGIILLAALADLLFVPSMFDWQTLGLPVAANPWQMGLLFVGVYLAMAGFVRRRSHGADASRILPLACAALLAAEAIYGSLRVFTSNDRVVRPILSLFPTPRLDEWFESQATPEDLLFVWGWRPEIYPQSRLGAATRFPYCADVADNLDHALVLEPKYDRQYVSWLLADLEAANPRFVVDASLCSIYGAGFRLDFVPPVREYLDAHYCYRTTRDGCDVYERCEDHQPREPPPDPGDTKRRLEILDQLIVEQPWSSMMLTLTRADVLAQAGRNREACEIYRELTRRTRFWPQPRQRLKQLACGP